MSTLYTFNLGYVLKLKNKKYLNVFFFVGGCTKKIKTCQRGVSIYCSNLVSSWTIILLKPKMFSSHWNWISVFLKRKQSQIYNPHWKLITTEINTGRLKRISGFRDYWIKWHVARKAASPKFHFTICWRPKQSMTCCSFD